MNRTSWSLGVSLASAAQRTQCTGGPPVLLGFWPPPCTLLLSPKATRVPRGSPGGADIWACPGPGDHQLLPLGSLQVGAGEREILIGGGGMGRGHLGPCVLAHPLCYPTGMAATRWRATEVNLERVFGAWTRCCQIPPAGVEHGNALWRACHWGFPPA